MGAGRLVGRSPPMKSSRGILSFKVPPPIKSHRGGWGGMGGIGGPMGCGWGADEACLRARGGRILRGSVDALER